MSEQPAQQESQHISDHYRQEGRAAMLIVVLNVLADAVRRIRTYEYPQHTAAADTTGEDTHSKWYHFHGIKPPTTELEGFCNRRLKASEFAWPQDPAGLIAMAKEWSLDTDNEGDHFADDVLIHKLANALEKALVAESDALRQERDALLRASERCTCQVLQDLRVSDTKGSER